MATRIRLRRVGRKKQPEYRIVVTDRRAARDGRFIETIGHYKPRENPALIEVDAEKTRAWLAKGATPSDTVRSLLKKAGVFSPAGEVVAAEAPVSDVAAPEAPADESTVAEAESPAAPSPPSAPPPAE
jgi:small subunit ribosomal protein S16